MLPSLYQSHPSHPVRRPARVATTTTTARLRLLGAAAVAIAALAGCSTDADLRTPPPEPVVAQAAVPPPPPVQEKEPEDTAEPAVEPAQAAPRPSLTKHLLAYADRVATLPSGTLTAEIARLTAQQDESVQQQLELALALGQTRLPADTARALGLAQRALAQKGNAPAVQSFARLLETRYLQQRRLEDQIDRQNQQIRDAQRKNDQLAERLEAVRAIERSLTARPGGPANGKTPAASAP